MNSLQKQSLALSLFAALMAAGSTARADTSSVGSEQFASGWQQRATPLLNRGPGPGASATTVWYVPGNVPKGHYVVVNRDGDKASVIDGYAVTITSVAQRQITVVLPQQYGDAQLVPSSDVPGFKDANSKVRFEGP